MPDSLGRCSKTKNTPGVLKVLTGWGLLNPGQPQRYKKILIVFLNAPVRSNDRPPVISEDCKTDKIALPLWICRGL